MVAQPQHDPSGPRVCLYDSHDGNEGHRLDYYALFARLLGAKRTGSWFTAALTRRPVLVGALEASMPRYVLLALARAALGRPTAGLLFRPLPVLDPDTPKLRLKRAMLRLLLRVPGVTTFTLLPFALEPRFAEVAKDWIWDPQLWDLHYPEPLAAHTQGGLAARIRAAAGTRRICCAIGRQDVSKGFDQFAQTYVARDDLHGEWLFAFGGGTTPEIAVEQAQFERAGGLAEPVFVDEVGLRDLYACADAVWCSYAPDYDQASGIFGRAVQLGVPVIVRRGTLIERHCLSGGLVHLTHDGNPANLPLGSIGRRQTPDTAAATARSQGAESVRRLMAALGLAP